MLLAVSGARLEAAKERFGHPKRPHNAPGGLKNVLHMHFDVDISNPSSKTLYGPGIMGCGGDPF